MHFLHLPSNTCYNNDYNNDYNKITSKGYNCHPGYSGLFYDNGRLDLANEICEYKNIASGTHSIGQQWWMFSPNQLIENVQGQYPTVTIEKGVH